MRVMVLIRASSASAADALPDSAQLEAMGRFNEALMQAGILLAGEGVQPASRGCRIVIDGAGRRVAGGPPAPAEDRITGFWLWEVRDMDEALDWAMRCPAPVPGPSEIEIRPVMEAADFGTALSPERAERTARMREFLAGL